MPPVLEQLNRESVLRVRAHYRQGVIALAVIANQDPARCRYVPFEGFQHWQNVLAFVVNGNDDIQLRCMVAAVVHPAPTACHDPLRSARRRASSNTCTRKPFSRLGEAVPPERIASMKRPAIRLTG